MNFNQTLRNSIASAVNTPAAPRISGSILQEQLLSVVNALDTGAKYMGMATPSTVPTTEANCFFLTSQEGTYANFTDTGGKAIVVNQGELAVIRSVIYQDNLRWQKATLFTGGGGSAQLAVSITYAALKALRDGGNLVPGTWYRITDYVCTTTQDNTQSAEHAFDVIVRADDASHLNENAFAAHHEGDEYFANCKLEAWELKYCLDNDTNRFAWADEENGTGVIFYMKDEWNNECPYDFKNIQFVRKLNSKGQYRASGTAKSVYTFNAYTNSECNDNTVLAHSDETFSCYNNIIKECCDPTTNYSDKLILNDIVFLDYGGGSCYDNYFGSFCRNNTVGRRCRSSIIEANAYDNIIGDLFVNNHVYQEFHNNTMGTCQHNIIGASVHHCTFVGITDSNIGSLVNHVTTGSANYDIKIGNNCDGFTMGSYFMHFSANGSVQDLLIKGGSSYSDMVSNTYVIGPLKGTSSEDPLTIEFTKGVSYPQFACLDSSGNLKIFNPADLVQ